MQSVQSIPSPSLLVNNSQNSPSPSSGKSMATEFESLVIGQLLKTMRSSAEDGGMFPGDKSDTYGGMFDMYFGKFLSENGGLGLASVVEKGMAATMNASPNSLTDANVPGANVPGANVPGASTETGLHSRVVTPGNVQP